MKTADGQLSNRQEMVVIASDGSISACYARGTVGPQSVKSRLSASFAGDRTINSDDPGRRKELQSAAGTIGTCAQVSRALAA